MVKFTVSSKHETLLSLYGYKKQEESLDKDKIQLERNFQNCATNLVKMNGRLAFIFSNELFENAPIICIISTGPSTELRPILTFLFFAKTELRWNKVFCDEPNESSALYSLTYGTDFSPNQLLCRKYLRHFFFGEKTDHVAGCKND